MKERVLMEHWTVSELPMTFFTTAEISHSLTTNETFSIKKFLLHIQALKTPGETTSGLSMS